MTTSLDPDFRLIPLPADSGPVRNVISSTTVYATPGDAFAVLAALLELVDEKLIVLPMVVCTVPDLAAVQADAGRTVCGYRIVSLGGLDPVLASLQAQALREAAALASGTPHTI